MEIQFFVEDQCLRPELGGRELVADSAQAVGCRFCLDAQWEGYTATAVFTSRAFGAPYISVQQPIDAPFIPWEVLRAGRLYVSVVGVKENSRLTTKQSRPIPVCRAGRQTGSDPEQYTPPLWQQVLAAVGTEAARRVTVVDENSTDEQLPSAKAVYDLFSSLETLDETAF